MRHRASENSAAAASHRHDRQSIWTIASSWAGFYVLLVICDRIFGG